MSLNLDFQDFPRLETDRLALRRIRMDDAPALFTILSDEAVTRYYDDDAYTDQAQAQEQIETWENGYQRGWALRWGIVPRGSREIIGTCGLYGFHRLHRRAGVGYELGQAHWQQGYMTEALSAVLEFGFDRIGLNRIEAYVMPGNTASIRLLQKLGFANEGLLAQYENWASKGFVDLYMFGKIRG